MKSVLIASMSSRYGLPVFAEPADQRHQATVIVAPETVVGISQKLAGSLFSTVAPV